MTPSEPAARATTRSANLVPWIVLLTFPVLLWQFWVGFIASDDAIYWEAAGATLAHFPSIGHAHWALRYTLVLSLAASRAVLGDSLTALTVPGLLYAAGTLVVLAFWLRRAGGVATASVALALLVTNPLMILWSSTATIDIVEIFFIFAAFALYARIVASGPRFWPVFAVGVLMGLAYMSRETSAFGVAALGVLFLAGFGFARRWYFAIALGFFLSLGAEFGFFGVMTGNPLYRMLISSHAENPMTRWIFASGVRFLIHPAIDPVVMLLSNHYFALQAWIGVPLTVWLIRQGRNGRLAAPLRQMTVILATLGLTWAVMAGGLWTKLALIPRYFILPSLSVSLLAGIALVHLARTGQRRRAIILGVLLVLANLVALTLENRNFRFGEWALADIAATTPGIIHTDPETFGRAALPLQWRGVAGQVVDTTPVQGDLYLVNPVAPDQVVRPGLGWVVVATRAPAATWLQSLLSRFAGHIPTPIWEKIGPRHPGVTLYRVG